MFGLEWNVTKNRRIKECGCKWHLHNLVGEDFAKETERSIILIHTPPPCVFTVEKHNIITEHFQSKMKIFTTLEQMRQEIFKI